MQYCFEVGLKGGCVVEYLGGQICMFAQGVWSFFCDKTDYQITNADFHPIFQLIYKL